MQRNVSGQKLSVYAYDVTTGLPKTGDAANLTAYVSKDDGSVAQLTDTSATEQSASNAPGYYLFDLAQAESDADKLMFSAKSSTSNIVVLAVPSVVYTVPANFTSAAISSGGKVAATIAAGDIATDAITAAALKADAVTEIQSGLATASALATADGKLDTLTTRLGAPADFGSGQSIAGNLQDVVGSPTFDPSTDSLEALRDHGDSAWATADVSALAGIASDADAAKTAAEAARDRLIDEPITTGTVQTDGGNAATAFKTDLSEVADDHWKDSYLLFTSGDLSGQQRRIVGYNGTTKTVTTVAFTATPSDGDAFAIINR